MNGENENRITCTGRILRVKNTADGQSIVAIGCKNGENAAAHRFICTRELADTVKENMVVTLVGHAASSESEGLIFVADTLTPACPVLDSAFGDSAVHGSFCAFVPAVLTAKGKVTEIVKEDGSDWSKIILRIPNAIESEHDVKLVTNRKGEGGFEKVSVGDIICVACSLSTVKKYSSHGKKIYTDVNILDIAKVG